MKRKHHLPLPQITTHPNSNIGTYLIPGKTVSSLHAQPKPLPLCPFSDKHSPRFTVHLYTIQLGPVARYRDGNNERERIYNAFINRNGHCVPNRINTICNDRVSDYSARCVFHPCRTEHNKQDKNCNNDIR